MRFRRRKRHVEIRQARDEQWYFVVIARNNEVTETSETYTRKDSAHRAARREHPGLPIEVVG